MTLLLSKNRLHRAERELKGKELSITDHKKKCTEVQVRLQEFAKLYDIIKVIFQKKKLLNSLFSFKKRTMVTFGEVKDFGNIAFDAK